MAASLYSNTQHYHYAKISPTQYTSYFNEANSNNPLETSANNNALMPNELGGLISDSARNTSSKHHAKNLVHIKEESQLPNTSTTPNTFDGPFLNTVYSFQAGQQHQQTDLLATYAIPTPNSSSSPQSQQSLSATPHTLDSSASFSEYSLGSNSSSSSTSLSNTNVAKVAASLSYASAISAVAAAVNSNGGGGGSGYHRYPPYLNNQIDCRRTSNASNSHSYASQLATHLQYQGRSSFFLSKN